MSYRVVLGPSFKRCLKKLEKRFPHVKDDVRSAIEVLQDDPRHGAVLRGGHGTRKFRIPNQDAQRGGSGGYRLIYTVEEQPEQRICLLLLYSKSDQADVHGKEIQRLLEELELL
jgi:mRNA-degrading endonuclease RelE of RelBE toxin-antitoxin system